ncbi:MAG TPA: LLM class flavin-dependent oxidoreductase, partial [Chloroflexota bacterium]|nr:LLM class flavin-dependent oxidoreductase [Chloroflexota bacterium]
MRFGFVLPGGTATEQLEQAILAERHGWDGLFVWEAAYGVDPWTLLAAIAQRTERIRLGTMLTPLPWRRPWKLASQVVTLDQLSNGRAILAVGLGAVDDSLGSTGEVVDRRQRAEMMDEGIDIITKLWRGEFTHAGRHYTVDLSPRDEIARIAVPLQRIGGVSRIPIWVVGAWNRAQSMRRVLRCDGLLPNVMGEDGHRAMTPADVAAMRAWLAEHGKAPDFDLIAEGETPTDDPVAARSTVQPLAD